MAKMSKNKGQVRVDIIYYFNTKLMLKGQDFGGEGGRGEGCF